MAVEQWRVRELPPRALIEWLWRAFPVECVGADFAVRHTGPRRRESRGCKGQQNEKSTHRPNENSTQFLDISREISSFWV